MQPVLIYHNQLDNDSDIWGRLELVDLADYPDIRRREGYVATSGLPGYQGFSDQKIPGAGPIPRMDVAQIPCYQVMTEPIYLPAISGVEGNFYPITPYMLAMGRGDFGVHFDAGVVGSAGCVVLRNFPAWQVFETRMAEYSAAGLASIPLLIFYS